MLQRRIDELQTESIEKEKIKKQLTEINEENGCSKSWNCRKRKSCGRLHGHQKYMSKE